jgi:hypothetical protein
MDIKGKKWHQGVVMVTASQCDLSKSQYLPTTTLFFHIFLPQTLFQQQFLIKLLASAIGDPLAMIFLV